MKHFLVFRSSQISSTRKMSTAKPAVKLQQKPELEQVLPDVRSEAQLKPELNQFLPQVRSYALSCVTPQMELEVQAILKRVYAEPVRTQH